jgi:hypothetical protein
MNSCRLPATISMLLLCTLTMSCGGDKRFKPTYPVRGQVFFEGKPAAGAAIRFQAVGVEEHPWTKPSAEVDDNGDFTVTTYRKDDGMPAGKYEVAIIWLPKGYVGPIEKGNKLPARYADPATSGLTVEVQNSENVLPSFHLTK